MPSPSSNLFLLAPEDRSGDSLPICTDLLPAGGTSMPEVVTLRLFGGSELQAAEREQALARFYCKQGL